MTSSKYRQCYSGHNPDKENLFNKKTPDKRHCFFIVDFKQVCIHKDI